MIGLSQEELEAHAKLTHRALVCMRSVDDTGAADALAEIECRWGDGGLFAAMCGWGGLLHSMVKARGGESPGGFASLAALDVRTGRQVSIDEAGLSPAAVEALRFFVAVFNRDSAAAFAFFGAAVDGDYLQDMVAAGLRFTADATSGGSTVFGFPGFSPN